MTLSLIVAHDLNGGIGLGGNLPWTLKDDLKAFKQTTMGHTLIVGHTTFAGMPQLVGRDVVVITQQHFVSTSFPQKERVWPAPDMKSALQLARLISVDQPPLADSKIFIAGGERVYRDFLPYVDEIHLTLVFDAAPCDRHFRLKLEEWTYDVQSFHAKDARNSHAFIRALLRRKGPALDPFNVKVGSSYTKVV